jgi:hypothetical protein
MIQKPQSRDENLLSWLHGFLLNQALPVSGAAPLDSLKAKSRCEQVKFLINRPPVLNSVSHDAISESCLAKETKGAKSKPFNSFVFASSPSIPSRDKIPKRFVV